MVIPLSKLMNVECSRGSCEYNQEGVCKHNISVLPCDKDLFRCKQCGYEKMKKDPLNTHACPDCGTTKWDIEPVYCHNCGHEWVPQDVEPGKICPKCGGEV